MTKYAKRLPYPRSQFTLHLEPQIAAKVQDEFPDLSVSQAMEQIAKERYEKKEERNDQPARPR